MDWNQIKAIDDDNCILVEFVNDRNISTDVGFSSWLETPMTVGKIDLYIKKGLHVGIYWPCLTIKCAQFLAPKLKKNLFQLEPAKILARGSKFD